MNKELLIQVAKRTQRKVKQELPTKAFLTEKQINRRLSVGSYGRRPDGVDERATAGEVSTAVTGGRSVSDISRSSSGSEPNERQDGGRDVERSGNQSNGLVGEIQSDNVTVGFDRPTDNERNSINSEIKSDYEQMDLFNNEKDESGATGFTDEEINELLKKGSGFEKW